MHNYFYCLWIWFILILSTISFTKPYVTAEASILIDALSGKILYSKNIHKRMKPASTTKIMTAILALEYGLLPEPVIASDRAKNRQKDESSAYLEVGEVLSLEDMLYCLLLRSANDAAVAIAEHISGEVDEFIKLMNKKAKEIGCKNTNFSNPHGFYGKNHYTTAYDLALISRYAVRNNKFCEIVKTKKKIIPWEEKPWNRVFINHNKLLWKYKYADGIKTGWIKESGHCLVASATKGDFKLIAVLLNSTANQLYQDAITLFEYGFNNFKTQTLIKKGEVIKECKFLLITPHKLKLIAKDKFYIVLDNNQKGITNIKKFIKYKIRLPMKKGDKVGTVEVFHNNKKLGEVDVITPNDIKRNWITTIFYFILLPIIGIIVIRGFSKIKKKVQRYKCARYK